MDIKNLAQLKRAINDKKAFEIVKHCRFPEWEGQTRVPNVVQTNGFYSVIPNEPNHKVSMFNDGKGSWLAYRKASEWKFEDGVCELSGVWTIRFV